MMNRNWKIIKPVLRKVPFKVRIAVEVTPADSSSFQCFAVSLFECADFALTLFLLRMMKFFQRRTLNFNKNPILFVDLIAVVVDLVAAGCVPEIEGAAFSYTSDSNFTVDSGVFLRNRGSIPGRRR